MTVKQVREAIEGLGDDAHVCLHMMISEYSDEDAETRVWIELAGFQASGSGLAVVIGVTLADPDEDGFEVYDDDEEDR